MLEKQNKIEREKKIMEIFEHASRKKKIKRIPPPMVPLPSHLIPKKLIDQLGL